MRRLTVLASGLLGPRLPPGAGARADLSPGAAMTEGLSVGALERALARAEAAGPAASTERELLELAGVGVAGEGELPVAAVSLLGEEERAADDAGLAGDGWWLRADPVHLRADLTDLVLTDPALLELSREDAERLAAPLAAHLARDGMRLHVAAADRWYLRVPEPASILTVAPGEALGRPVSSTLPRGDDASGWHTRINEAQMILHASDANRERGARGLAPVNSVWLWGGGALPAAPAQPGIDAVAGAGVLGRGLARLVGARSLELPERYAGLDAALESTAHAVIVPRALAVAASLTDVERWREALAWLDAEWIAPAFEALGARRLEILELRTRRTGALQLGRSATRRFWRRTRPLASWMDTAGA